MPVPLPCTTPACVTAVVCLLFAASAQAAVREEARALSRDDGRLLYRETHLQYGADDARRVVLYRCPDGAAFARKTVLAHGSPSQPDFAFHDARTGYREGVRTRDGRREIFVDDGRGDARVQPLPQAEAPVIDAGFDAAVRAHWADLSGGARKLSFLLPERFAYMPVRVAPAGDADGQRRLRMSVDRWFGFAVPPIELRYGLDDRRLREFIGPGTVRDARGKPREVRIVFPETPQAATQADVDAALAAPLDGRCAT